MGREVRRVRGDWQHPKDARGRFIPLFEDYGRDLDEWKAGRSEWEPLPEEYMPSWTEEEADHLMMYENTSEGTPISPVFKTAEKLARWLADNRASAFAHMPATYEQWLTTIGLGSAPSAVITYGGPMISGVAASRKPGADQ